MRTLIMASAVVLACHPYRGRATDWANYWRGPKGLGVTLEEGLSTDSAPGRNVLRHPEIAGRGASSPIVTGDRVFLTTETRGQYSHAMAFDRQTGEILWDTALVDSSLAAKKLWPQDTYPPDCPTQVASWGNPYCIRDDGMASVLNLKTRETYGQERLFSANVKVSPVAGDSEVYCTSGNGSPLVVKAGNKPQLLSTNHFNQSTLSSPAISHGNIFIRTDGHLYCIGKR